MRKPGFFRSVPVLMALAAGPVWAQAPDCTGISNVYNTSPDFIGELTTVRIATGLSAPVFVTQAPGDDTRLYVLEQAGIIRLILNGVLQATPFMNITTEVQGGGEQGLLGLAFHPDYQNNGYFFVYHTKEGMLDNVVARYERDSGNPNLGDPGTREEVITFLHPGASNHNGGMIAFGPEDGMLYIATGDGGGGCDPGPGAGNAQTLTSNLGKMLRLDVDTLPYETAGNPFDGITPGNDEIWSLGLRNPWRWSFDRITGAVYIGDVGQGVWEEVSCSPGGGSGAENYGWVPYEGAHCPNPSCGAAGGCVIPNLVNPISEYNQAGGPCAITGGYVYRGCRMGDLQGTYFFSDYCAAFFRSFRTDSTCAAGAITDRTADLAPGGGLDLGSVASFGEDNHGEVYIVDQEGEIFKILPNLSLMEVSGDNGATPLTLAGAGGDWTWENLQAVSGHPVRFYRVYRSDDGPTGTFNCVFRSAGSPKWTGGDLAVPPPDEAFFYLVTAQNVSLEETKAGTYSDGTQRVVNNASVCPP